MTIIANPIYDAVFKFLLEDNKVAIILLSALLKKEIVKLDMNPHEYTSTERSQISLFRVDFSARVREADGSEHIVLIELQKTWLPTETLRFRQYLGTQYLNKDNMCEVEDKETRNRAYGLPIVSIYILGHKLGNLTEPVVYVRRRYLDYDENVLPSHDRFIESLTHDSIIVQIPFLTGKTRNRLERILSVFDQVFCRPDEHFLEIDEDNFSDEAKTLIHRLLKAAVEPEVRRSMQIEDEILSEIESRDTEIMESKQMLEQSKQELEQSKQELEQSQQEIEQKKQELEQSQQALQQKDHIICSMVKMLYQKGIPLEEISRQLSLSIAQIEQYIH